MAALADAEGQLMPSSRRMYRIDAEQFAAWMLERGLTPKTLIRSDVIAYRAYLQETYCKATAERKLVVARRLLEELVIGEVLPKSPAYQVKGFKLDDETPHVVLTEQEAQALLDVIDIGTLLGRRDYVVILLLLRTGLRRSEAAQLSISDITMDQGHYVAIIQHSKGDRRRTVKLPVDVWREIDGYIQALKDYHAQRCEEQEVALDQDEETRRQELRLLEQQHTMAAGDPLFVVFRRGDHPTRRPMGDKAIGRADEAERLLRETLLVKTQRRKIYKLLAEKALKEIENARAASPDAWFQLDWRWVRRYRMLSAYDAYWWWAPAGPFTDEEQRQWEKVFAPGMNESVKDQLREILMRSRDRELSTARVEHREPRFSYPALDIAEVQQRIADFLQLDAEIVENEPNVVVRRVIRQWLLPRLSERFAAS